MLTAMRFFFAAAALSLAATSSFAAGIWIDPPAPTTHTDVTLHIQEWASCPPPPKLTRNGYVFTAFIGGGPCLSPPVLVTFDLALGKLEAGDYEVVVNSIDWGGSGPGRIGYATFYVRDADAQISVQGVSYGPTSGGTEVILSAYDAVGCFGSDLTQCPIPTVTFNGFPATVSIENFKRGTLSVTAPPNAKGIADVVVTGSRGTKHGRVFQYYDPAEAPPSSLFERVLVPVWSFGPGAYGSNWITQVSLLNNNFYVLEPYNRSPARVAPGDAIALDFGVSRRAGVLFFPPREFSDNLSYGSLVRDTSRQAEDWGAEVPIVRESEFRARPVNLLNVSGDARFRATLRIYDPDSVDGDAYIRVNSMPTGANVGEMTIQLRSATPCVRFAPCASDEPASATVDLGGAFPGIAAEKSVRVQVMSFGGGRLWAFITITNNQTQHVTTITPQ
jgi:hypothetical protein